LINFLTCRNLDRFDSNGRIRINGKLSSAAEVTRSTAYVQQDDLFLGFFLFKIWNYFFKIIMINLILKNNNSKRTLDFFGKNKNF